MKRSIDPYHPIRLYFADALLSILRHDVGTPEDPESEAYLIDLLVEFVRSDRLFASSDGQGQIRSILDLIPKSDVLLEAESFEEERTANKLIGDHALFCAGFFPEVCRASVPVDYVERGKAAYYVVGCFDHDPYAEEAPMFLRLSDRFEAYRYGYSLMRASFEGFACQGWTDGFTA